MEWSSLELKLICCSDLKAFNLFQKLSVYAVVSIVNGKLKKKEQRQNCLQRQKTPLDREGGGNPEWNRMMKFDIKAHVDDCSHLFIAFDLYSEGVVYGINSIGKVRVPLKDLIDEFNGAVRFLRYQVRTSDGKPNGVLNFCYKLNGTSIKKSEAAPPEGKSSSADFHFSAEKVHYPSVEVVDEKSSGICYPSLDFVQSPLSGFYSPSPKYEYKATTRSCSINMSIMTAPPLSPSQFSPVMVMNGSYYHPSPSPSPPPFVQSPRQWYMESTGYSYGYGNAHDSRGHPC